jgi:hypothetical protein
MGMRAKLIAKAIITTVQRGEPHGTKHCTLDEFVLEPMLKGVLSEAKGESILRKLLG